MSVNECDNVHSQNRRCHAPSHHVPSPPMPLAARLAHPRRLAWYPSSSSSGCEHPIHDCRNSLLSCEGSNHLQMHGKSHDPSHIWRIMRCFLRFVSMLLDCCFSTSCSLRCPEDLLGKLPIAMDTDVEWLNLRVETTWICNMFKGGTWLWGCLACVWKCYLRLGHEQSGMKLKHTQYWSKGVIWTEHPILQPVWRKLDLFHIPNTFEACLFLHQISCSANSSCGGNISSVSWQRLGGAQTSQNKKHSKYNSYTAFNIW